MLEKKDKSIHSGWKVKYQTENKNIKTCLLVDYLFIVDSSVLIKNPGWTK